MKDLLTAEGLVAHMEKKGITFNRISKEDAQSFLEHNNYYMKLASYRANYKKYPNGSKVSV